MLAFALQILLLMAAAYFLGAAVACIVRRSLFLDTAPAAATVARHVDPLPEVDPHVTGARRFVPGGLDAEPASPAPPAVAAVARDEAQDLKRIHQIDAAIEARLNEIGVRRYEQIAAWMRDDIQRITGALSIAKGLINRQNWIEQAQVLAKGGLTQYAARLARGETVRAAPSKDEGVRMIPSPAASKMPVSTAAAAAPVARQAQPPAPPAPPAVPPRVSERAAFARAASAAPVVIAAHATAEAAAQPQPVRSPPTPPPAAPAAPIRQAVSVKPVPRSGSDDMRRISGIDGDLEKRLAASGVARYEQIAGWTAADIERIDRLLGLGGRIGRENWIEQAQILSKGGDTAFSRGFDRTMRGAPPPARPAPPAALADPVGATAAPADAPQSRSVDLGALRSVRSQAYQEPEPGPEAAHRVGSHNRVVRAATPSDLKRIRGIGVLIEKRLNAMRITSYDQIANWTAEDIERVSRSLDFKGRIERENWVEQARILASGGATEFSRRVDRGEVETSRYRP